MSTNLKSGGFPRLVVTALSFVLLLSFLVIPMPPKAEAANCSTNYTVVSGDSLSAISAKFNVSSDDLIDENSLTAPYTLRVGQVLCIPAGATVPTATSAASTGSTTTKSTKPSFTASRTGDLITIQVANYPSKAIYYVRVDTYKVKEYKVYKLGRVRLNAKGNVTQNFVLPTKLRKDNTTPLNVCIKHATKDAVECQLVY